MMSIRRIPLPTQVPPLIKLLYIGNQARLKSGGEYIALYCCWLVAGWVL